MQKIAKKCRFLGWEENPKHRGDVPPACKIAQTFRMEYGNV